jgi:quinol-cytochrome oxidoreductase complex cytochrome b subunit
VLLLVVTGILEMFFYVPTPDEAAESVQTLAFLVPYGWLVRNLHYWAAQLLVVVAIIHLLRVALTGAYAPPRRFNYLLGLALLLLSLLLDFTGYVLRWDEGVQWALVAGTNLVKSIPILGEGLYRLVVGGTQPGPAALIRFYAWHIFGLTLALVGVGAWHLFRVRRDGGIAVPPPEARRDASRISRFELVHREALTAILATAVLIVVSSILPAPIAPPIGEGSVLATEARAPWFFLWVQQLLKWGDPFIFGVFIPTMVIVLLAGIPYWLPNPRPEELGRWFPSSNRAAQLLLAILVIVLLLLTILSLLPSSSSP